MALVANILVDAFTELGVLAAGETLSAPNQALGLLRLQNMIDTWQADRLTLSLQLRTTFLLTSGTSSVQVGTGQTVNITRPMFLNSVTYVIPGTNPAVEVPIGLMDQDSYANLSIKTLPSSLPIQAFYQTNLTDSYGTLFFWPQVSQNVTIALYSPQAVDVPASVNTNLIGPPGYAEAFLYQLAMRLVTPLGVPMPPALPQMAAQAFSNMKRPNVEPGMMGIDAALMPHSGSGYNVLSDGMTASNNR